MVADAAAPVRLILLPGMDGTDILFGPLLAELPASIRPTVVTLPGEGPQDYEGLWPVVAAAVQQQPRCWVLGWSFSGPLALRAAVEFPDRVAGVILAASFIQPPFGWLPWVRWLLRTPVLAVVRVLRRLPLWLFEPADSPLRRAKARLWRVLSVRVLAARARAIARLDARGWLAKVDQPVLYLAGAGDRVVAAHNARQVVTRRAATDVTTVPGGHFMLFAEPGPSVAAILAFVMAHTGLAEHGRRTP